MKTFFEELYSNQHYSVLSRHTLNKQSFQEDYIVADLTRVREKVTQVIYLADRGGKIMPLLERRKSTDSMITNVDFIVGQADVVDEDAKLKKSATSKKVKKYRRAKNEWSRNEWALLGFDIKDRVNFKDLFGKDYRRFKAYTEKEGLNPKRLEDLIKALDFKS